MGLPHAFFRNEIYMQNTALNFTYDKPWIEKRADPYVYRDTDGTYYFTASLPKFDGIAIRKSHTLRGLADAREVRIWNRHASGPMSFNIWAPELHKLDGSWYIYFAASEQEDIWKLRPYVLSCHDADPVTGTWTECGPMQCAADDPFSFRAFSLDATVFENRADRYFVWAEKVGVGKQISNLYIARMASPVKLATVQELLSTPDYSWERHGFWVNEGPAVLHHDGKIYLTFSASDTSAAYCMGLLCADEDADLLDPASWHKEPLPVMRTDEKTGLYGPGHNSFTQDDMDGSTVCVFHARTGESSAADPLYDGARHAYLLHVAFEEDGKPVFVPDRAE